jgi:hypothetical protein
MKKFFTLIFNIVTWGYFIKFELPELIKLKESIKSFQKSKEKIDTFNIKLKETIIKKNNEIELLKKWVKQ